MEKPYRRKIVDNTGYFTRLIVYIHQNPQKHGFVDDFRDWPWSSYYTLTTTKPTHLKRDFVISSFGSIDQFVEAHRGEISVEIDW